jgi:hypothetical protein
LNDRELWLAAALAGLSDVRNLADSEAVHWQNLATRLAELLAPAEIGVLVAQESGGLEVAAASSDRARHLASLDAAHQAGPATEAFRSGHCRRNQDLETAGNRWLLFVVEAKAAAIDLATSLVLRRDDEVIGAASVLCARVHPLSATDVSLAQILAEAATTSVLLQRELRRTSLLAEQLQRALDSRVIIEQAKGALAARLGIEPDQAFEILRGFARRHHSPLADVAAQTVRGELTSDSLLGDGGKAAHDPKR